MSVTYFQVSSQILASIRKPFDLETAARIVDSFKSFAVLYLRRQFGTYGIDSKYALSYLTDLKAITDEEVLGVFKNAKITVNKIFKPANIQHSSPFLDVTDLTGLSLRYYSSYPINKFSSRFKPHYGYTLSDQKIIVFDTVNNAKPPIDKIIIKSVFEDPADILIKDITDMDDLQVEIPLPMDFVQSIIADILKVQFGMVPKEDNIEITKEPEITTRK